MIIIAWTKDQDEQLAALWAQKLSAAAIGRQLSTLWGREVTKNAVVGRAHRLHLQARATPIYERGEAWAPEQEAQLRELWGRGITVKALARLLGRSPNAVASRARRLDLPHSRNLLRQSASFRSSPRPPSATTRPRHPMAVFTAGAGATPSAGSHASPERAGGSGAVSPSLSTRPAPVFAAPAPLVGGKERGCRWPMWGNERPTHLYCGEARRDVACSYCPTHAARAFTVRAPSGALTAGEVGQPQFARHAGASNLTIGSRFYA